MDPDARKKTLRRSRQPLSRYGQRAAVEGSAPSSPVVIKDMEYDDPYDFVDSQSLQPDTQPAGGNLSRATRRRGQEGIRTPVRSSGVTNRPLTPCSSRLRGLHEKPLTGRMTPKVTPKHKLSPGRFTEDDRLWQQEEEDLKRAMDASLQEKKKEDRKRRREANRESGEFSHILSVHESLNETAEIVDPTKSVPEFDCLLEKHNDKQEILKHTVSTSQETELTQPLPTSCSVNINHLPASPSSRQVKLTVKKLSLNCLRVDRPKTGNESTNGDETHLSSHTDKTSNNVTLVSDKDVIAQSIWPITVSEVSSEGKKCEHSGEAIAEQQQSDFYKEWSLENEMEQGIHISESDETPPLSPRNASDLSDVNSKSKPELPLFDVHVATISEPSGENYKQSASVGSKVNQVSSLTPVPLENDCFKTVDVHEGTSHLTVPEDGSRHSLQALDLKETAALTNSSNIDKSVLSSSSEIQCLSPNGTPAEITKAPPVAPVPLVGLESGLVSTPNENSSKERERAVAKSRSSSLSLRRSRKRTSAERANSLITEEDSNKSLTRSPSAKKLRVSEDIRIENPPAEIAKENSEIVRQSVPVSDDLMGSNHEDKEGVCSLKSSQVEDGNVNTKPSLIPGYQQPANPDTTTGNQRTEVTEFIPSKSNDKQSAEYETRKRLNSPCEQSVPKRLKSKGTIKLRKREPHAKSEDTKVVHVVSTSQNIAPQNEGNIDQSHTRRENGKEIERIAHRLSHQSPKITTHPPLPTMYCPKGGVPSEHTPLIIQRFNSYFYQLCEAQSHVLTRLKWGEPVKVSSSRQTHLSLDIGRKTRRSRREKEKGVRGYYIDLPRRKLNSALSVERGTTVSRVKDSGRFEEEAFSPLNEASMSRDGQKHKITLDDQSGEIPLRQPPSMGQWSNESPRERETQEKTRMDFNLFDSDTCNNEDGTDFERDCINKTVKKSCVDVETESLQIVKQADPLGIQTSRSKASDTTSAVEPSLSTVGNDIDQSEDFIMLDTQGDIVRQTEYRTSREVSPLSDRTCMSDEDNTLLKTSPLGEFDKDSQVDDSDSWLSSREPRVASTKSLSRKRKQKRTNSTPKTTESKKKTKSGSSAAAKMMLQFAKDSGSNSDQSDDDINHQESTTMVKTKTTFSPSYETNLDDDDTSSQVSELNCSKSKRNKSEFLDSSSGNEEEVEDENDELGVAMELDDKEINNKKTLSSCSQSESVIDLTEDTQAPYPFSPHFRTSQRLTRSRHPRDQDLAVCPMCCKMFPPAVIQIHAAQCDGTSDNDDFTRVSRSTNTRSNFERKGIGRRTKTYQPTLLQLVENDKERATIAGDEIDSDGEESENERSYHQTKRAGRNRNNSNSTDLENFLLDDLHSALESETDCISPVQTDSQETSHSPQAHATETRLIPSEGGGFIVDMSTVSNSPIRTFTKISDLDTTERDRFLNQFKGHSRRGGRRTVSGSTRPTTSTWGRDGFDELVADRSRGRTRGRGRRGRRPYRGSRYKKRSRPRN